MLKPIAAATLLSGTADLLAAFMFAGHAGMPPEKVLRFVASGPFGDAMLTNSAGPALGVLTHFAIMACMVSVYFLVAARWPLLTRQPLLAGTLYGLLLWFVMYWIVRPLRWEALGHPTNATAIAGQLFCHIVLVGVPVALIAARYLRRGTRMA